MESYNPKPVFELIASELFVAMNNKDWKQVEAVYEQLKELAR